MANKSLLMIQKTRRFRNSVRYFKTSTNYSLQQKHYDVAIAGGGLVGTAMACALAKNSILQDRNVVLFEANPQKQKRKLSSQDQYSNRVVSLNPGTRQFLESLGAWELISNIRYKTVKQLQVWDACSDASITFKSDSDGDVSYIVENNVILQALEEVLQTIGKNITIVHQSKIKNIELPQKDKLVKLTMENGDKYTCNLLIGAEGANSETRKTIDGRYLSWNYNQMGIVANLKLSETTDNSVAWQRFLPTGPIALLPLTDETSSLVWSINTEKAKELLKLSDESFADAVNDAFWKPHEKNELVTTAANQLNRLLERCTSDSDSTKRLPPSISSVTPNSRAAFPLGFGHATRYATPGAVIVGDAAHRVHPLAGQGVNLGFGDVQCLAKLISEGVYSGQDLGRLSTLRAYESERQRRNFPTMVVIDCLQKLYGTDFPPVVLLRTLGLEVTQSLNLVKKTIMRYASA